MISWDHREIVAHVENAHADREDKYIVGNVMFPDKTAFEEWERKFEDDNITRWATQIKKTYQSHCFTICDAVEHCRHHVTLTLVTELQDSIQVEFCRRHCGHEQDSALLTTSEAYIATLLKDGIEHEQVLGKIREGCRTMDTMHTRPYYTTTRDIRTIALRNKVDPARMHDIDAESVEIRIRENNVEDGIRLYSPAVDESGEGFVLGSHCGNLHLMREFHYSHSKAMAGEVCKAYRAYSLYWMILSTSLLIRYG
ncbi:hypothetical protein Aduo_005899 [Ancylostoma duodenale]